MRPEKLTSAVRVQKKPIELPLHEIVITITHLLSILRNYPYSGFSPEKPDEFCPLTACTTTPQFHDAVDIPMRQSQLLYHHFVDRVTLSKFTENKRDNIRRFAYSKVRIDLTGLVKGPDGLENSVKEFLAAAIKESEIIPQNPFRICVQVDATNLEKDYYKEQSYISEIILTGTLPKHFKNFDATDMDISRAILKDYEILRTMKFDRTKINRQQFLYMLKNNFLKTQLGKNGASIDLSFADISGIDCRSVPLSALKLRPSQDLTGCVITVTQANALANAGVKTLESAIILKDEYIDEKLNDAVIQQGGKIRINATALEKLFGKGRIYDVNLDHYDMSLPELEIVLAKLHTGHLLFRATEHHAQLPALLRFLQAQIKKHKIEKMILSHMFIQDIDFTDFNFDHIVMENCTFEKVNFEKTHCEQTQFRRCTFQQCAFNDMYISPKTIFENPDFTFTENAKIDRIHYQKDKTYVALNPIEYYNTVRKNHKELLTETCKSPLTHGFFEKTDSKLSNPRRSSLAIIFSFFLQTLLGRNHTIATPQKATQCFVGTLFIEAQRKRNEKGITNKAAEHYLTSHG